MLVREHEDEDELQRGVDLEEYYLENQKVYAEVE